MWSNLFLIIKKIGLGTAQWGTKYGVTNFAGKTNSSEVIKILSYASSLGISYIDTAPLYGDAEFVLGKYKNLEKFKIITKTIKISKSVVTKNDALQLINTFYDSLDKLKLSSVHGLLIHDANDILVKGSEFLIDALKKLKAQNKVKKIGISVNEPKDLALICTRLEPDIVQLPINVLDQRFIKDKSLNFLKKKGIEIHARSIFLQGLLLNKNLEFPVFFKKWSKILERWRISCHKQRFSFMEASLSFTSNIKEVDCFILGFENIKQFSECVNFLKKKNRIKFNAQGLECNDINLINPVNWKTNEKKY